MKCLKYLIVILLLLLSLNAYGKGNLGLGVILGEPTGISAKFWTSNSTALCFAAGWSLEGTEFLHLQGDFILHKFNMIPVEKGSLPLYFGIGGRFLIREGLDDMIGVRVPAGLDYMFEDAPIDIFLEIVPVMNLIPDTDFDIAGGIGIRYFF